MNDAVFGILLTAEDQATPKMRGFGETISVNRMALRQLAMGVSYLGSAFLGLGIAMEKSNNPMLQQIGNMAMLVGGIMSAVGSSIHFIYAIGGMISALQKLRVAQILAQAFSGPVGWAALGIGAGIAAGAVAGTAAYSRGQATAHQTNVTVHVQGSVVTEKQLVDTVQKGLARTWQQNARNPIQSGLTP